jgi:hypothetical protein
VRSRTLNVNTLVYLPSLGTFQISEIYGLQRKGSDDWQLIQQADPTKQDTLDVEAHYDEMNTEQTWPTEHELNEGIY